MKKFIAMMLIVSVIGLSGCEAIQKKFTRKPKKPKKGAVRFQKEDYTQGFPNDVLYNNHYLYWRNWEDELIAALKGDNEKKHIQCAMQAYSELKRVKELLAEPKSSELEPYLKELEGIKSQVLERNLSPGKRVTIATQLASHRRRVEKHFYTKDVKDFIVKGKAQ